jgi:hypothetical protein
MFRIKAMLAAAVRNNAAWVAAVHGAHGHAGEAGPDLWLTRGAALPFYPNAITLTPGDAPAGHQRALVSGGLPVGWTVKDSYAALDLAPLGFAPLLEAQWIARPVEAAGGAVGGLRWAALTDPAELAEWEHAWRGQPANATEAAAPLFLPALLADPDLRFLAGRTAAGKLAAGLVANRSGADETAVVGVSNVFLPDADADLARAGGLAAAEAAFPGLPLVGYEHGADLEAMWAQGFVVLGPLRVWAYVGGNPG